MFACQVWISNATLADGHCRVGESCESSAMRITITNYLDVISSWCFWAEPMWKELKSRYAGRVDFEWRIALMDASGFPKSREQAEWFYRRSGMLMRSPFMLKPGWFEPNLQECLAPNLVAEAARDLGVTDDRVRLALANATVREGRQMDFGTFPEKSEPGLGVSTRQS